MRHHHTKNKGDLGAIQAMADMATKGWRILLPLSEHEAFDFVAYQGDRFLRVQAKYRTATNGGVLLQLSTTWADRHGVHVQPIDRTAIDLLCIYSPDTNACYYLDPATWAGKSIVLRLEPPRNNQAKRVTWARDCTQIPASVRGLRFGSSSDLVDPRRVRQSRGPRARSPSAHSSVG